MAFCANCGAPVEGRFCAKCGASVQAGAPVGGPSVPTGPAPAAYPAQPQAAGMSENVASALCYVLFAGAIFLALEPYNRNRNIRFHAFQGLFLFGAAVAIWFIMGAIFTATLWGLGMWSIVLLIRWLVDLALFALWLYAIIQAAQGKRAVLPFIGPLAEQQANK